METTYFLDPSYKGAVSYNDNHMYAIVPGYGYAIPQGVQPGWSPFNNTAGVALLAQANNFTPAPPVTPPQPVTYPNSPGFNAVFGPLLQQATVNIDPTFKVSDLVPPAGFDLINTINPPMVWDATISSNVPVIQELHTNDGSVDYYYYSDISFNSAQYAYNNANMPNAQFGSIFTQQIDATNVRAFPEKVYLLGVTTITNINNTATDVSNVVWDYRNVYGTAPGYNASGDINTKINSIELLQDPDPTGLPINYPYLVYDPLTLIASTTGGIYSSVNQFWVKYDVTAKYNRPEVSNIISTVSSLPMNTFIPLGNVPLVNSAFQDFKGSVPVEFSFITESGTTFSMILSVKLTYDGLGYSGLSGGDGGVYLYNTPVRHFYDEYDPTITPKTPLQNPTSVAQPIMCGLSGNLATLPMDYPTSYTTFSSQPTVTANKTETLSLPWNYGQNIVFYAWFGVSSLVNVGHIDYNLNTPVAYIPALGTTVSGAMLGIGNQSPTLSPSTFKLVKFVIPAKTLLGVMSNSDHTIDVRFSAPVSNVTFTDMQSSPLATFVFLG